MQRSILCVPLAPFSSILCILLYLFKQKLIYKNFWSPSQNSLIPYSFSLFINLTIHSSTFKTRSNFTHLTVHNFMTFLIGLTVLFIILVFAGMVLWKLWQIKWPNAPRKLDLCASIEPVMVPFSVRPSRRWKSPKAPNMCGPSVERTKWRIKL